MHEKRLRKTPWTKRCDFCLTQGTCAVTIGGGPLEPGVGKWQATDCQYGKAFICKGDVSEEATIPAEVPPRVCLDKDPKHENFTQFGFSCYLWAEAQKTWQAAEDHCRSLNAHLVSLLNPVEQAFAYTQVGLGAGWIGLSLEESDGQVQFSWSDGWEYSYQNWPYETAFDAAQQGQQCAYIDGGAHGNGKWAMAGYQDARELPYLCKSGHAPPELLRCRQGWIKVHDRCLLYEVAWDGPRTFDGARQTCRSKGGDLVVIRGNLIFADVSLHAASHGVKEAWIGLQREAGDSSSAEDFSHYVWVDGTVMENMGNFQGKKP